MSHGFAVVVAQALVRPTGPPLGPAGWQSHLRTSTTCEREVMATGSSPEIIATSRWSGGLVVDRRVPKAPDSSRS